MQSIGRIAVLAVLATTLGFAAVANTTIVIKGSTTNLPIAQLAAEEFHGLRPDITVSVQGGGSGTGVAAIIDGTTDIANSSRPMKASEWSNAVSKGVLPYNWHIASDGLAVVVHPTNPVQNLTFEQIRGIYSGAITNWSAVGGPNLQIVVVSRDTASGTFESFKEIVLAGAEVRAARALFQASTAAVEGTVATTPGAIGYIGLGYLNPRVKAVNAAKDAAGPFVAPTLANVINATYPIARPLFMITNGFPTGAVLEFIMFVLSDAGQQIVQETGFVPIRALGK